MNCHTLTWAYVKGWTTSCWSNCTTTAHLLVFFREVASFCFQSSFIRFLYDLKSFLWLLDAKSFIEDAAAALQWDSNVLRDEFDKVDRWKTHFKQQQKKEMNFLSKWSTLSPTEADCLCVRIGVIPVSVASSALWARSTFLSRIL